MAHPPDDIDEWTALIAGICFDMAGAIADAKFRKVLIRRGAAGTVISHMQVRSLRIRFRG
jgi:hypothetical protein